MCLQLILSPIKPGEIEPPQICPHKNCNGRDFQLRQTVQKPLQDIFHEVVVAHRYQCLSCHHTFRVYPPGVNRAQISLLIKNLAVLLYLLGLSYGTVSLILKRWKIFLSKSSVYEATKMADKQTPNLKHKRVKAFMGLKIPAIEPEPVKVKYKRQWLPLTLNADETLGLALNIGDLSAEDAAALKNSLEPIARAMKVKLVMTDKIYQTLNTQSN